MLGLIIINFYMESEMLDIFYGSFNEFVLDCEACYAHTGDNLYNAHWLLMSGQYKIARAGFIFVKQD